MRDMHQIFASSCKEGKEIYTLAFGLTCQQQSSSTWIIISFIWPEFFSLFSLSTTRTAKRSFCHLQSSSFQVEFFFFFYPLYHTESLISIVQHSCCVHRIPVVVVVVAVSSIQSLLLFFKVRLIVVLFSDTSDQEILNATWFCLIWIRVSISCAVGNQRNSLWLGESGRKL